MYACVPVWVAVYREHSDGCGDKQGHKSPGAGVITVAKWLTECQEPDVVGREPDVVGTRRGPSAEALSALGYGAIQYSEFYRF